MQKFAERASKLIPQWEIIDYAHDDKIDAPSGTARELAARLSLIRRPEPTVPVEQTTGERAARGATLAGAQVHSLRLPGRPRAPDRACLTGILFVLRSGIPWQMLPLELACGSGMTCWRRLRDWQQEGMWDLMHFALLTWLARDGDIDWSRAIVDSCSVPAVCGGTQTGPNPTDRAKCGSKRHLICDGQGVPLAVRLTGAKRNDSQEAVALIDTIPPLQGERGRPRRRPGCVLGDRGYDAEAIRRALRARHILPLLAKRRVKNGSGLGRWRWVVERTFAWLNQFRRLRVRYDKRADIHEAFLSLGCAWICWQSLRKGRMAS